MPVPDEVAAVEKVGPINAPYWSADVKIDPPIFSPIAVFIDDPMATTPECVVAPVTLRAFAISRPVLARVILVVPLLPPAGVPPVAKTIDPEEFLITTDCPGVALLKNSLALLVDVPAST
jgi:hypothetical protein